MNLSEDALRLLLDDGPWTAGRLAELADEVGSESEARRLVAYWAGVEKALRHRVEGLVPDRTALVLLGLERCGRGGDLTDSERARLSGLRDRLVAAERECPAIGDVIRCMGPDADDFDREWTQAFGPAPARRDRPAVRRTHVPMKRVLARFAMAASVVAFVILSVFLLQRDDATTSIAAVDGIRTVNLSDGSSVRLMAGAELVFTDRDGSFDRRVTLSGKGYFNVRPDDQPFLVLTPSATVTVLGTSFGVDSRPDETAVVLVSGRVAVAPPDAPEALVVLEPGQRTRIARGDRPGTPDAVDAQRLLDWTRLLFFRSTPLTEVADRLSAAYGVRIEIAPALAQERVTGTFDRDRDLDGVLEAVATAVGADIDRSESGVVRLVTR